MIAGMPHMRTARVERRAMSAPIAAEVKNWRTNLHKPNGLATACPKSPAIAKSAATITAEIGKRRLRRCAASRRKSRRQHDSRSDDKRQAAHDGKAGRLAQSVILLRAEKHRVMKIRVVSEECALDAGGLPLVWLTEVKPAESVAMLTTFVRDGNLDDHITTAIRQPPRQRRRPDRDRAARRRFRRSRARIFCAPISPKSSASKPRSGSANPAAKLDSSRCKKWQRPIPAAKFARMSRSRFRSAASPAPSTK